MIKKAHCQEAKKECRQAYTQKQIESSEFITKSVHVNKIDNNVGLS
jgi:hypothetical protein